MIAPAVTYGRFDSVFSVLLCIVLLVCPGCSPGKSDSSGSPVQLLDFENSSDLDRLNWKCGTLYQRVREHQASGVWSLMVEMYPGVEWPGFGMEIKDGLAGFKKFSFNAFNPSSGPLSLSYRIDDRRDNPSYADRANGRIILKSGPQVITLDLEHMKTSGTGRLLDRENICCFLLFTHRPERITTFFLDNFVLK